MFRDFSTSTAVPELKYPAISGFAAVTIPLTLLDYKVPSRMAKIVGYSALALWDELQNNAVGGNFAGPGPNDLPKLDIGGFWDNPLTAVTVSENSVSNRYALPSAVVSLDSSVRMTYGDYIVKCYEGRGHAGWDFGKIEPTYFKDSYGRQFNSPTITEVQIAHQPGTPSRQNFNITMVLTTGYDV